MQRIAILIVAITASGCATSTDHRDSIGGSARLDVHSSRLESERLDSAPSALAGHALEAYWAQYMNRQIRDLQQCLAQKREQDEARVETAAEGIKLRIPNHTAFGTASDEIKPIFKGALDRLSEVLIRYPKTSLTIVGHTDGQGDSDYNQFLSQRRAKALSEYLRSKGIDSERLGYAGKGATEPVSENETAAGRMTNARIEILLKPRSITSGREI